MHLSCPIKIFLILCAGLHHFALVDAQDVSSFLGQLMKNYVAKNTRYYTILNGVPVQESADTPPDNSEILSRISSVLPEPIANSPILSQILEQDSNSFPNSWTPIMSDMGNSYAYPPPPPDTYSPPSTLGRRYAEMYQRPGAEESKIITMDDLPAQFNIQSSMAF